MSDTLVINEIYLSLQGESTFAGLAVHFHPAHRLQLALLLLRHRLRLHRGQKNAAGGNPGESPRLAAPFSNSELSTPNSELPLVELTGGEPLLQKNSLPLMKSLCDDGFTVLLETSGAHDISPVDPRVHRIMDLKCPSSGEAERNRWENLKHLKATDEIKFVIGTAAGLRLGEAENRRAQAGHRLPVAVFVGASAAPEQQDKSLKKVPAGQTPISRRELAEKIIADALPVRFQVQMHKIIWPPEQRGV